MTRSLAKSLMELYRNNLRDNVQLDSIMVTRYIRAIENFKIKLDPDYPTKSVGIWRDPAQLSFDFMCAATN